MILQYEKAEYMNWKFTLSKRLSCSDYCLSFICHSAISHDLPHHSCQEVRSFTEQHPKESVSLQDAGHERSGKWGSEQAGGEVSALRLPDFVATLSQAAEWRTPTPHPYTAQGTVITHHRGCEDHSLLVWWLCSLRDVLICKIYRQALFL